MAVRPVLPIVLMTALLSACGTSSTSSGGIQQGSSSPAASSAAKNSTVDEKLEVLKVGFGERKSSGFNFVYAVALFHNVSKVKGTQATAQFSVYDAGGQVIGSGSQTETVVRADQTLAVGANITGVPPDATVDHVTVQIGGDQWQTDPHPTALVTGQAAKFSPDAYSVGSGNVNGSIVSHYTSDLKQLYVQAICYDGSGKPIGGGFTFLDLLAGGSTVGASVSVTVSGTPTTCELYAAPSNLS